MGQKAHITGKVEYREGDGPNVVIRPGACEVDQTAMDATISWADGETRGSAAMPISDFNRLVASKAIQFVDSPVD